MLLSIFDNLPTVRRSLAILTAVAASGNFISSAGLLGYQRAFTYGGYQRCLPAIIVVSFFAAAAPLYFLYCPPFSLGSSGKLRKASLFARSIAFELAVYAAVGAYLLVVTADLHADTPGLLSTCGGYTICRLLQATLAFCWITILFLALLFTSILASSLYLSARRHSAIATLTTSFGDVDWAVYSSRSRRGAGNKGVALQKMEAEEQRMQAARESARQNEVFVVMDEGGSETGSVLDTVGSRRRSSISMVGGAY